MSSSPSGAASPPEALRGTIQNDMLKEFIAQKEWICGVRPSLRIIRDMLVHCTARMPLLEHDQHQRLPHPRGGCDGGAGAGVHARRRHRLRRAGPRRRPGRRRVRAAAVVLLGRPQRLLRGDREAARGASDVGAHHARPFRRQEPARLDVARARADRGRLAGRAAAAEQRRAHDAAGAGGACWAARSRCTPTASTRRWRLPTEAAATLALRTQQIIAEESGLPAVADPLGGSYYVESLTDRMQAEAERLIRAIDDMGGIVRAVELGLAAARNRDVRLPHAASGRQRRAADRRRQPPCGRRNSPDPDTEDRHVTRARRRSPTCRRCARSATTARAREGLEGVRRACAGDANVMDAVLEAARRDATLGEICRVFRDVFGEYRDPAEV